MDHPSRKGGAAAPWAGAFDTLVITHILDFWFHVSFVLYTVHFVWTANQDPSIPDWPAESAVRLVGSFQFLPPATGGVFACRQFAYLQRHHHVVCWFPVLDPTRAAGG